MKFKIDVKKIKEKRRKNKRINNKEIPKNFMEFCIARRAQFILMLAVAVSVSILIYKTGSSIPKGIVAVEDGSVLAVDLSQLSGGQINLNVEGELGDSRINKEVTIRHEEKKKKNVDIEYSDIDKLSVDVSRIVRDINRGEVKVIELPQLSPEGAKLSWSMPTRGAEFILPMVFPVLIMFFVYRDAIDKEKQEKKREREIIVRELPGFNNKLVLLMESGLIYDDAVNRISSIGEGLLASVFSQAIGISNVTNGKAEKIIADYAREKKIPELSRLISIISEGGERGTDLREKLRGEGELLWEKRKRQAEEQGKLADTKLALPLGMMLISLLIVTAAPALMQF